jgi:putative inorganic carbon (HCO3(-)) transporter
MGFFAFYFYTLVLLVRPQDWWSPLHNLPVVSLALLIATISVLFNREKTLQYPQFFLIFLLVVHVVLSSVANGWFGGGVAKIEPLTTSMLLPVLCAAMLIDNPGKREKIFKLMIYAALFMVFNGVTQRMSDDGFGFVGSKVTKYDNRITYIGILDDPNDLGMYFVMILPIIVYFVASFGGFKRYVYFVYGIIVLYGVYLTNSRGTLLGVIALLGVWHLFHEGIYKTAWRAALALPVLLVVMSKFRAISAEEDSAAGRLDAWYEGMQMFLANPVFGVGQGGFLDHHGITAHNSFVLVFAELGFPGYFIWLAILFLTIFPLWKLFSLKNQNPDVVVNAQSHEAGVTSTNEDSQALTLDSAGLAVLHGKVLFYSMMGYLATAFFLSRSYTPLLYLFIGICISCLEELRRKKYITSIEPFKKSMGLIAGMAIGSIFAVWLVTKLFI